MSKGLGIKEPAPLPHPVHVVGAMIEEEKAARPRWEGCRDMYEVNLRDLKAERDNPSCHKALEKQIEGRAVVLEIIGYALDGRATP